MDTAEHRRDNRLGLVVMANAGRDVPVEPISTASLRATGTFKLDLMSGQSWRPLSSSPFLI